MGYNLFLDDERNPQDVTWIDIGEGPWTIVRNETQFVDAMIRLGVPDKISWDNDLGTGQGEGITCVNWLIEAVLDGVIDYRPFTYTVHSKNPIAAQTIQSKLDQFIQHMGSHQTQGSQI